MHNYTGEAWSLPDPEPQTLKPDELWSRYRCMGCAYPDPPETVDPFREPFWGYYGGFYHGAPVRKAKLTRFKGSLKWGACRLPFRSMRAQILHTYVASTYMPAEQQTSTYIHTYIPTYILYMHTLTFKP